MNRIFGELLESTLIAQPKLQVPFPPPGSTSNTFLNSTSGSTSFLYSTVNPSMIIQHPGYFYLIAARSEQERWNRFNQAKLGTPAPNPDEKTLFFYSCLEKESKLDHANMLVEGLTKAYEMFKKYKGSRMTLFIAFDIARIYQLTSQFELAIKFYERIGKTLRKEGWLELLGDVCSRLLECGENVGDVKGQIESLVELIYPQLVIDSSYTTATYAKLIQKANSLTNSLEVDMSQILSFLLVDFVFKRSQVQVNEEILFQFSIENNGSLEESVHVEKVVVGFSDLTSFTLTRGEALNQKRKFQGSTLLTFSEVIGDLNGDSATSLDIGPQSKHVFQVSITRKKHQVLSASSISIYLTDKLVLMFKVDAQKKRGRWLVHDSVGSALQWTTLPLRDPIIRIEQREPLVVASLSLDYQKVYVDELVPVLVTVQSSETEAVFGIVILKCFLGNSMDADTGVVFYQNADGTGVSSTIQLDLGLVAACTSQTRTVYVKSNKIGPKTIVPTIYTSSTRISVDDFDLSAPDLLWKDFDSISLDYECVFELVNCTNVLPVKALPDSGMGPLVSHDVLNEGQIQRKMRYLMNLSLRLTAHDEIYIEKVFAEPIQVHQ